MRTETPLIKRRFCTRYNEHSGRRRIEETIVDRGQKIESWTLWPSGASSPFGTRKSITLRAHRTLNFQFLSFGFPSPAHEGQMISQCAGRILQGFTFPRLACVNDVQTFLSDYFDSGKSYCSVNVTLSMLSTTLFGRRQVEYRNKPAGQ